MSHDDYSEKAGIGKVFGRLALGLIILAMVGSLALMDFGDMISGGISNRNTIAKIGNDHLSVKEFALLYDRALRQNGLKPDVARQMGLPTMLVQQEMERRLLVQAANGSGIRIGDKLLAKDLMKELKEVDLPGTPQEKLEMILKAQGVSEKEFTDMIRGDYAVNTLAFAMEDRNIQIPEEIVLAAYRGNLEKRQIKLITVPYSAVDQKTGLDDAALQSYYDEHKDAYRLPEKRTISALLLPKNLHTKTISISDAQAKEYYDENPSDFMTTERVKMEQVIFQDEDKAKEAAQTKADNLQSFKGDDAQYLSSDWYAQTSLPRELSGALWPAKTKGISGPVKTSLGWHVLYVSDYQDAQPQSFDTVKSDIKRMMQDDALDKQINDFTDDLDRMITNGEPLKTIANKYGLKTKSVSDITTLDLQDTLKSIIADESAREKVQTIAFEMKEAEISSLIDTKEGDFLMIEATDVTPSTVPSLESIKDKIRQDAQQLYKQQALKNTAEDLIRQFDPKDSTAFEAAIAQRKLSVKNASAATQEQLSKTYDAQTANLAFALSAQNTLSYVQNDDNVTLIWLQDIIPSTETPDEKTRLALRSKLRKDMMNETRQQFLQFWRNQLGMDINMALLQQLTDAQNSSN